MANYVFSLDTSSTTEVSHGDVTFTLSGTYTTGNYVDGPAYVVVPSGTATITAITPAETTLDNRTINGAMKNPQNSSEQAYDERRGYADNADDPLSLSPLSGGGYYNPALKASLPLSVTTNDVVVKAKANLDVAITNTSTTSHRRGLVSQYGALFVVPSAPAAGTFAPAATGWSTRSSLTGYSIDVASFVSGLPSYATTGHDKPTYAEIMARIGKFNPYFAMSQLGHRFFLTESFGKDADNYGLYCGANISGAMYALISDGYTTGEKEAIATALFSHGIQWFDPLDGDSVDYGPDGGLYQFHFGPIAMALSQTSRTAKYGQLLSTQGGNFRQAIEVTSTLAGNLVQHSDLTKPYPYRNRNLNNVSGNTLTIETWRSGDTSGDNSKFDLIGFTVTNGSATATVTSGTGQDIPAGTSGEFSFDVDDATGFATNDTVHFYPPIRAIEGDFDWAIRGYDQISQYSGQYGTSGEYRELNEWTGLVLSLRAMGIWDSSWNAIQGVVMANNRDNWPLPTWNFSSSHGEFWGTADNAAFWDNDFWTDHAATILDLAAPVISSVTATPGNTQITVAWSVNKTGKARVMAFPNGATATLPARLMRGTDDSETAAVSDSGIITVSATGAQTNVVLTGLTNGVTYDVYLVAYDQWTNPGTANAQDVVPTT